MLDHANCCFKLRQEGEKTSEYCMLLFPMVGIKPGPPAQQLSGQSISPFLHFSIASRQIFSLPP